VLCERKSNIHADIPLLVGMGHGCWMWLLLHKFVECVARFTGFVLEMDVLSFFSLPPHLPRPKS
jgi:hypothetical protein